MAASLVASVAMLRDARLRRAPQHEVGGRGEATRTSDKKRTRPPAGELPEAACCRRLHAQCKATWELENLCYADGLTQPTEQLGQRTKRNRARTDATNSR